MSINNAKNSLKIVVMDDKLRNEFLNLKNDEIFEFCKKNSKGKFNREEFRQAAQCILMAAFPEECGATELDESLEKVAGGANRLTTRLTAYTLALTSICGCLPAKYDTPFSAPSATVIGLGKRKHYVIPHPWDVDEIIEEIRKNPYFKTNDDYDLMCRGLETDIRSAKLFCESFIPKDAESKDEDAGSKDKSTKSTKKNADSQGMFEGIDNYIGRKMHKLRVAEAQSSLREANKRLELAERRRFTPLKDVTKLKDFLDDEEKFKKAWKANDTGKNWWVNNISKNTYYVPASSSTDGFMSGFTGGFGRQLENVVPSDEDLAVITTLQTIYWKKILELNGFSDSNISLSYVEPLIKSKEFCETVNSCFGQYVKQLSTGDTTTFATTPATSQMYGVVQAYAQHANSTANAITMDRMKRYAPLLVAACSLFYSSGALQNLSNLIKQGYGALRQFALVCYNRLIYNRLTLEQDPVKLRELLSKYLKANIMCQDRAIDRIVEIISGMADLWRESDRTGKGGDCACTMVFMGDSGIGKTLAARCLSLALFHKDMQPWQFVTSTAITSSQTSQSSSKNASDTTDVLSPADQLFNVNSEIVRQLTLNNRVVIVLDEVDKMHKSDPDDTIVERLRDARDTGKLLVRNGVNYFYIDVSRTVFILITNETRECWGLPPVELTPEEAASRTKIERDKSLVNRFYPIEFGRFTSEGYQTVLRPQLEELVEEYRDNYNININITDELVESIGDAAERCNKGVRGVNDYLIALRGKLVDYRSKHKVSLTENNLATTFNISVVYDQDTNSFELIDAPESSTNEKDVNVLDVPYVPYQDVNLSELIDAKKSLTHKRDADVSNILEHDINSSRLIDEPIRENGR